MNITNLFFIFLTGLTTGGLSCLAVQGGLLASVIANQKEQEHEEVAEKKPQPKNETRKERRQRQRAESKQVAVTSATFNLNSFDQLDWMPVLMFLSTKLVAHVVVGFLLGWLGSFFTLSLSLRLVFQTFAALFMFGTAMNLLDVHPIFRFLAFQPPRFLQRMVRSSSKSRFLFAPAILGVMTVFIPCGVTQAMEVLAINSGSPIQGALIMLAFVLGTSPLFAILGVATAKLSEGWYQKFSRIAAGVLIAMAIYSVNGVLLVMNSPLTLNRVVEPVRYFFSEDRFAGAGTAVVTNGTQQVTINVLNSGYQPRYVKVKKGLPVELTLQSNETYSCALAFVLREFGINTFLDATDTRTFNFTPQKTGRFTFTCSMGMYSGVLEVI